MAEHKLSPQFGTLDAEQARVYASAALKRNAGDVRSLRVLGQVAGAHEDQQRARALFELAGRRTWRDTVINLQLLQGGLSHANANEVANRADAILRSHPETQDRLFPGLKQITLNETARNAFEQRLAKNPPWRRDFILALSDDPKTAGVAFQILTALQSSKARPTDEEVGGYLSKLIDRKEFDKAYLSWILFLPSSESTALQGLYNGSFEVRKSLPPFNWDILDRTKTAAQLRAPPDSSDNSALYVTYDGASNPPLARQLMMLAPGQYRIDGSTFLTSDLSRRRFDWTVICGDDGQQIGHILIDGPTNTWSKFSFEFQTTEACGSQWLWLKPNPGGERAQAQAWFDKLILTKIDEAG